MSIGGDPILFPDAESAVIDFFESRPSLSGVQAYSREPNPLPATFLLARQFGSNQRNLVILDAYITVEAWAPTKGEASDLARRSRAELWAALGTFIVPTVFLHRIDEVGGLAWSPDPDTARPRYLYTASVSLRGGPAP